MFAEYRKVETSDDAVCGEFKRKEASDGSD
jgi:hypothetical protein